MSSDLTTDPQVQPNLAALLLAAFRWFDGALTAELSRRGWEGLTRAHAMVMTQVREGGVRPAQIARLTGVSRQAAHQTINELVQMGLVELSPDPDDKRAKLVVVSPAGWLALADAVEIFAGLELELGDRIGGDQVYQLREALSSDWGAPPEEVA